MFNYIIQVLLFQMIFLAIYDLILKKETFFQWNRGYLIGTSILAYILPFLKSKTVSENLPQEFMVMLPEVVLSPKTAIESNIDQSILLFDVLGWVYWIGISVAGAVFLFKLVGLSKMIRSNRTEIKKDHNLVLIADNHSAFSFFKYVFVGNGIRKKEEILMHELVHVKQRHSVDLMFFEMQKIVVWFNPFSFLFQKRVSEIHEFIADSEVVHKNDKSTYFQGILAEVFQIDHVAFVNSFYKKSIIKKRIIMLSKNKSKEILKLKYLFVIPLFMGMLIYTSCNIESNKDLKATEMTAADIEKYEEVNNQKKKMTHQDSDKEIIVQDNVPFAVIDYTPIFPGCEDLSKEDQKKCFATSIQDHINTRFDSTILKGLGLEPGKQRIYIHFKIDKSGRVADIKSRAPHKKLVEEAKRVVSELPQMEPGIHQGKKVSVKFTLPIVLVVD